MNFLISLLSGSKLVIYKANPKKADAIKLPKA